MARPDKAAAVAELTDAFRESSAAVLTEYRGLTVAQLKELRRSLAGNATYSVVKNTLTKIAAREAGVETLEPLLEGPSAIAFVTGDPVEVAKSLKSFGREHPLLVVKGGVLDGRPITADEVKKLADLESREVLLGKLAGGLNAPATKLAAAFAAPAAQLARLFAALVAKAQEDPSILAGGAGTPAGTETDGTDASDGTDTASTAESTQTAEVTESTEAADAGEMPTDATPGVEETPEAPAADAAGDEGAAAEAVADATDVAPDTDVAGDATSAS